MKAPTKAQTLDAIQELARKSTLARLQGNIEAALTYEALLDRRALYGESKGWADEVVLSEEEGRLEAGRIQSRVRSNRDPSNRRWRYFVEDLKNGENRPAGYTKTSAKALAKLMSISTGHPVAVVAVDTFQGDTYHPQGAYYGKAWREGEYHYRSR